MGAHPCGDEEDVLGELFAGGGRKVITHAAEVIGRDLVFSHIAQGLGHESAGTTGERQYAAGIPTEIDLEISQHHAGRCSVGVVNQLGWNLGAQPELIGSGGGGRKEPQIPLSADGIDDGVRAGTHFSKKWVAVRRVVETVADSTDSVAAHQAGQRHADGAGIAQIRKIMRGERPARPLRLDPAEDLLWVIGGGNFHVENNARFFQRIKRWFPVEYLSEWRLRCGEVQIIQQIEQGIDLGGVGENTVDSFGVQGGKGGFPEAVELDGSIGCDLGF